MMKIPLWESKYILVTNLFDLIVVQFRYWMVGVRARQKSGVRSLDRLWPDSFLSAVASCSLPKLFFAL